MNQNNKDILPSALERKDRIIKRLKRGRPAIFLDYDGTLTPIVDDPSEAVIPERARRLIKELSRHWTVAILSGRALDDVRNMVGLDNLVYAGSHGFNVAGPKGSFHKKPGKKFLPALDSAESALKSGVKDLEGVRVERKPFAIAVHYRQADNSAVPELEKLVNRVVANHNDLSKRGGKKIFELRPKADWDKGKVLLYLLEKLLKDSSRAVPLYIGDDTTDEDAFKAIAESGIGILVSESQKKSYASYIVRNPEEVQKFLEELVVVAEKESSADAWSLTYSGFEPGEEKHRETLCALGNGYFAARGAAPECRAGAVHYPGTYVAGLYNRLESRVAGHTIENESLVNAPNWLPLTFRIEDGEWIEPETMNILEYEQKLDMGKGVLRRSMVVEDGKNRRTRVVQRRLVHMRKSHLAALETTITPENWSGRLHLRSALDGKVENTLVERYRQLNNHHLEQLDNGAEENIIWLQAETTQSHIRIAEAARTEIFRGDVPVDASRHVVREPGYIAHEFVIDVEKGKSARIEKTAALYNSRDRAISESLLGARKEVRHAERFSGLLESHILAWDHLWERWKIDLHAQNPRIEQIMNLHIFHLLQTVSPNTVDLDVGVPPRGLHGEAYRGLIMWDELFIFPLLNLRIPDITRALLQYRYRRLPRACRAAEEAGYAGAMFPWQSGSNGREQAQTLHLNPASGRWVPDSSQLERHINLAIAYNIWQYYQVTGDKEFIFFYGAEILIKIARFWAEKARYNSSMDRYEILKVMGPDEFHDSYPDSSEPGIDNNAYTNVMAAWLFCRIDEMLRMLPEKRRRFIMEDLDLDQGELDRWDELGHKLRVPFHGDGIISQFEGYEKLQEFDWEGYRKKYGNIQRLDRILESEDDSTNRYKVSKQADVLMLFYLLSAEELAELFERLDYPFERRTIPDNIDYYLKRTSNGSTLSRVVHAWVLSRSKREMSWRLFQDALESDIEDIQGGTTKEGIHLGAMAGTVDLMLRCYSGIESRRDILRFNPELPEELKSVRFEITYRRNTLQVEITGDHIKLANLPGPASPVEIGVKGETFELAPGDTRKLVL